MIQDIRYWASRAYITVSLLHNPEKPRFPRLFINKNGVPPQIKDEWPRIWADINKNNRVENAIQTVFYDYLRKKMRMQNKETLSVEFRVGYIYFMEHCLYYDDEGHHFELEMCEVIFLLAHAVSHVKKCSRRIGKTTSDVGAVTCDISCFSNYKVGLVERNWKMCKEWLEDEGPRQHLERSPFLLEWSGGTPRTMLKTRIFLKNGSGIITTPVKLIDKNFRGKGLRKAVEEEKSQHPVILTPTGKRKASGLGTVLKGQMQRPGVSSNIRAITGTPDGIGTEFYRDEQNPRYLRLFAPIGCPMGYERWVCNQRLDGVLCPYFSLTLNERGESDDRTLHCLAPIEYLPPNEYDGVEYPNFKKWFFRISKQRMEGNIAESLNEAFYELGRELWLQEFMGENIDFTGNAYTREMLANFMDDSVETAHEAMLEKHGDIISSDKPCVAALDTGRTEIHQTVLEIFEQQDSNLWHIIRVVYIQDWLKRTYGIKIPDSHYMGDDDNPGILDYVLEFLKGDYGNYNIVAMVGDATGPGGDYVEQNFKKMFMEKFGFDGVIPFKIETESEKFGGGKMGIHRALQANMQNGRLKSIYNEKLRLEALAWVVEEMPSGKLKGHAPQRGKIRSDDGLLTAMLGNWLAFTYFDDGDFESTTIEVNSLFRSRHRPALSDEPRENVEIQFSRSRSSRSWEDAFG